MSVCLLTSCAVTNKPYQTAENPTSQPARHRMAASAVDDSQEPPAELLRIKQASYQAAMSRLYEQAGTLAGDHLVSPTKPAANDDRLAESKLTEDKTAVGATGLPVAYSKIESQETVWMAELRQIEGRQQIAQQWRILREQFPDAMAERFVVARPVDKKRKMYAIYVGNFADIELGEAWCEVVRVLYPACQVLPSDAIGGGSTSLRMSLQLSAPEIEDGTSTTPTAIKQVPVAPSTPQP
mgnify:CR=1 FL=1